MVHTTLTVAGLILRLLWVSLLYCDQDVANSESPHDDGQGSEVECVGLSRELRWVCKAIFLLQSSADCSSSQCHHGCSSGQVPRFVSTSDLITCSLDQVLKNCQ